MMGPDNDALVCDTEFRQALKDKKIDFNQTLFGKKNISENFVDILPEESVCKKKVLWMKSKLFI